MMLSAATYRPVETLSRPTDSHHHDQELQEGGSHEEEPEQYSAGRPRQDSESCLPHTRATWGAGASPQAIAKMSRRKQQNPRQFPLEEDMPSGLATELGITPSSTSPTLADDVEMHDEGTGGLDEDEDVELPTSSRPCLEEAEVYTNLLENNPSTPEEREQGRIEEEQTDMEPQTVHEVIPSLPALEKLPLQLKPTGTENRATPKSAVDSGESSVGKDQEDYLDPDEEIDEDELDEMDYDINEDSPEDPNAADFDAAGAMTDSNVKLAALQNTRVAVAQIVENNFAPAEMIPSLLQTICNLQQQQMFQLQLLQMLQAQLLKQAQEQSEKSSADGGGGGTPQGSSSSASAAVSRSSLPASLAMLGHVPGMLPLPKLNPINNTSSTSTITTATAATVPTALQASASLGSGGKDTPTSTPVGTPGRARSPEAPNRAITPQVAESQGKFPFISQKSLPGTPSGNSSQPNIQKPPAINNNNPLSTTALDRSQYAAEDPFFKHKCKFCHKILGSDSALQIHVRSHTGEKPYKCNICANRFSTKGNLKVHFERHKQQYPHIEMDDNLYPEDPSERQGPPPLLSALQSVQMPLRSEPPTTPGSESSRAPALSQPLPPSSVKEPEPKIKSEDEKPEIPREMMRNPFCSLPSNIPPPFHSPMTSMPSMLPGMPPMSHMSPMMPPNVPLPAFSSPMGIPPPFGMDSPMYGRNSILPPNDDDEDSMEEFMECSKSETSKLEALVQGIETKLTDPNQCAICRRILSCKSALQMHYRTHTGERPFKCKICGRAFTTKGNLKTHMGVHRTKPPLRMMHQCPVCHKQFTNSLVLQQHIRTHTGADTPKMFPDMIPPMMNFPGVMGFPGMPFLPPGMQPPIHGMPGMPGFGLNEEGSNGADEYDDNSIGNSSEGKHRDRDFDDEIDDRPAKQMRMDEEDMGNHTPQSAGTPFSNNENQDLVKSENNESKHSLSPSRSSAYDFYQPKSPLNGNNTYSTSLAALEDRVKAIGEQGINHFAPFKQMDPEGFQSLTKEDMKMLANKINAANKSASPPNITSPDIHSEADQNSEKNHEPPSLQPYGETSNSGHFLGVNGNHFPHANGTHMSANHSPNPEELTQKSDSPVLLSGELITPPKSDKENDFISPPSDNGIDKSPRLPAIKVAPISTSIPMPDPSARRRNDNPRHMCHVCEKPFSSSSALQIHMRTHTGERPFKCEVCAKGFTTRGNLKVHMSTHMQQCSPARRGRRMSVEGIPGLTPPKEHDFFGQMPLRPPGTELFPPGFPFPGMLPMNGLMMKPNAIPVIQNAMGMSMAGMFPQMKLPMPENGENNNNALGAPSPSDIAKQSALAAEFFKDKMAAFDKHRKTPTEQGLNLSVK